MHTVVPRIFSRMQADSLYIFREAPGENKCLFKQRLIQKSHSNLSSFAGCLLDYLKTEEGSQLNLPKLIDMSAQVSEQPLGNRLKTMICYCLSEILASLKSVGALISWRKTAPPGVLSEGFSLSPLVLMYMSAQQCSAVLRTASGELTAVLEKWGLFAWVCFGFFLACSAANKFVSLFTKRKKNLSKKTFNVETRWLSVVLPF